MAHRHKFARTYYGLSSTTILSTVMLEIIKDLGARHYATIV